MLPVPFQVVKLEVAYGTPPRYAVVMGPGEAKILQRLLRKEADVSLEHGFPTSTYHKMAERLEAAGLVWP